MGIRWVLQSFSVSEILTNPRAGLLHVAEEETCGQIESVTYMNRLVFSGLRFSTGKKRSPSLGEKMGHLKKYYPEFLGKKTLATIPYNFKL